MEAKGFLHSLNNDIRPVSRSKFVDYIIELDNYKKDHPNCFSRIEKEYFQRLKGEFRDDLAGESIEVKKNFHEPHFYSLRKKNVSHLFIDLLAGYSSKIQFNHKISEEIYQPYYGSIIRGSFNNIHFYSDNRIYSEWGRDTYIQHYNASQGYPVNTSRDSTSATWDVSKSYFCFTIRNINFLFGREKVKWGPSKFGSLMFSGLAPDFDQLQLKINLFPFTFIWLHGSLRSDISPKWISSHRLAISLTDRVDIGLHESVIYGDRNLELAYLNPVIPYLIAEHTLGDKDNVSLGFDFNINLMYGFKIYGELLIDDLFAPWELFSDYWGNKFAVNIGTFWIDPLLMNDCDLRMEYTRVEPYVYSHRKSVNVFENYNFCLGSFLQPNSDCLIFEFRKFLDSFLHYKMKYYYSRHGEGNRREPHKDSDGNTKKFLAGIVEKYNKISTGISGEIKRDLRFDCDIAYVKADNYLNAVQNNKKWWEFTAKININW
ncbi:MAG: capsule assembly Wzi family protein [bacterium]